MGAGYFPGGGIAELKMSARGGANASDLVDLMHAVSDAAGVRGTRATNTPVVGLASPAPGEDAVSGVGGGSTVGKSSGRGYGGEGVEADDRAYVATYVPRGVSSRDGADSVSSGLGSNFSSRWNTPDKPENVPRASLARSGGVEGSTGLAAASGQSAAASEGVGGGGVLGWSRDESAVRKSQRSLNYTSAF